ncbi:MAG: hypothetical protein HC822_14525 [Oscillochloris sp.]|nr:hypothetical protein [Oscillochloris sp.]
MITARELAAPGADWPVARLQAELTRLRALLAAAPVQHPEGACFDPNAAQPPVAPPADAEPDAEPDQPVEAPRRRRRLRDSAPAEWHYQQLAQFYAEYGTRQAPAPQDAPAEVEPEPAEMVKGPPRNPDRRRAYFALLGKARNANSPAQRRYLQSQARAKPAPSAPIDLGTIQAQLIALEETINRVRAGDEPVGVARLVLYGISLARPLVELGDLEKRIAALEERYAADT